MFATSALCAAGLGSAAFAQDSTVDEIVVVGSQIQGSKVTAALPVTVLSTEQIQATAAGSGDELFRTIPQAGNVTFNSQFLPGSSNSARGDVNSVSLRNLGAGNTLMLLNGRRTVYHPTTQAESLVPTFTFNTNAIPVAGLRSIEVLRDGAAAIYGTDAVAGVINTVLQDDYDGGQIEAQYGTATGTNLREGRLTGIYGKNFQDDRGNITIFGSMEKRSALLASDQDYTAFQDKRPLFAGTEFANTVTLDNRAATSAFGAFQATGTTTAIRSGATAITGATGIFHYVPQSQGLGCAVVVSSGLCIVPNAFNTTTDRAIRPDAAQYKQSVIPQADRINIFATGHYDITDELTFFTEAGYYHARTEGNLGSSPSITTTPLITIAADAYYNPLGPVTLANGQPNPNRLPGLVGVPTTGRALTFNSYGFLDVGNSQVIVTNDQYRLLGGLRGKKFGFNWESAALYSMAKVHDVSSAISANALQAAINRTTPDAYNPFNGGNLTNPVTGGDPTPSSSASIASFVIPLLRDNKTTLALWDFKVNRPDLYSMWAGDIGIAAGVEVRRETYSDNRDDNLDGTILYRDAISGVTNPSNIPGTSNSPDVSGHRTVMSAFAELAVPLVSPDMGVPLVDRLEVQLAGRFENYSDVGDVAKPKIAAAWDLVPGIRFRGSWSQGFKAPNLEQINVSQVSRTNGRQDYYFCEADLRRARITAFTGCTQSRTTRAVRAGNPNLKPETSESLSYGIVLQPEWPAEFGRLTMTVDVWKIRQKGVIGLFGEGNAVILDYLLRLQGSSNPAVHRLAPTPDNQAVFAGTTLPAVGFVDYVDDQYVNQLPQIAQGVDFGVSYRLGTDSLGDFNVDVNMARLDKFYQSPTEGLQTLLAARAAGQINAGTIITGGQELVGQNGVPAWRGTGSFSWSYLGFRANWFSTYTGKFYSTGLTYAAGGFYRVPSTLVHNVSLSYEFEDGKYLGGTRFLIGARNVFDKDPPLAPNEAGYAATVYNPYGRYLYVNIRKTF